MTKHPNTIPAIALSLLLAAGAAVLIGQDAPDAPTDNLDFWLEQSVPAEDAAIDAPPGDLTDAPPAWALPAVVVDGEGAIRPGVAYRNADQAITVYETASERYRRVPLAACLSITSALDARMENEWLWSETGSSEKVYTGLQYPLAEVTWTFLLADGNEIVGTVKGQAIHFVPDEGEARRLILSLKVRGEIGQTLDDLKCFDRIIISRRARDERLDTTGNAEAPNPDDSGE